jgi:hypothetical protein
MCLFTEEYPLRVPIVYIPVCEVKCLLRRHDNQHRSISSVWRNKRQYKFSLAQLTHHWVSAGEREKAAVALEQADDQALGMYAFAEAEAIPPSTEVSGSKYTPITSRLRATSPPCQCIIPNERGSAQLQYALLPLHPDRERRVPAQLNKQGSGDSASWSPSPCYSTVVAMLWQRYLVGILLAMGYQIFIPDGAYQPNRH